VARNCLLLKLYQAVGQPHGLSPWDFMHLLYERFDPKPEDEEAVPDVGRFNERLAPLYDRLDAGAATRHHARSRR
jgi:hypothetical protein